MPILCFVLQLMIGRGFFFVHVYCTMTIIHGFNLNLKEKTRVFFINLILVIVIFLTGQGPILFSFSYYHYQNTSSCNEISLFEYVLKIHVTYLRKKTDKPLSFLLSLYFVL